MRVREFALRNLVIQAMLKTLLPTGRGAASQVVYLRVADMIKRSMGETVPLGDRITMQSASLEVNRVLCLLASKAAGYHIEEIMQASDEPRPGCPADCHRQRMHCSTVVFAVADPCCLVVQ